MDKFLEIVLKEIRERRMFVVDNLAGGNLKDFSEYQKLCGEIRGYSLIEGYILDLARQLEHSDDE